MKNIFSEGLKISLPDKKALEHYLLVSPKVWTQKALEGMVNKATKSILRDWLEKYKAYEQGTISLDYAVLIPAIVAMPTFRPYNMPSSAKEVPQRDEAQDSEIWPGGFQVEDWQDIALSAFYEDYEQTLMDFMQNKIAMRKNAFVKHYEDKLLKEPAFRTKLGISELPSRHDALINAMTADLDYKNRAQTEVTA